MDAVPALDKAIECLTAARLAADAEERLSWEHLARLWINLANEASVMTLTELRAETSRLGEIQEYAHAVRH
jgi:hypothetical protein